jgi:hypothetical protein
LADSWLTELGRRLDPENDERVGRAAWTPQPGPQTLAIESPADVTGYGGAAGGGKTDWLLGTALTRHRKSIVFRREFVQLRDVISRTKDILADSPDAGRFNGQSLTWRFDDGRSLELGAVQREDDWRKYRGRPHDFIGIDEATEFLENQVRGLLGWLRTTVTGQRCRIGLTFNPPTGPDGQWVVRWFAPWLDETHPNPAKPGELRWYATVGGEEKEVPDGTPFEDDGEMVYPQSRTFIPARLSDNPYQDTPEYRATLQSLPEPLRSQLLKGDFAAGTDLDPWQVIPTAWVKQAQARWRAQPKPPGPMTCIGLDVAHGGKDKTVIAPRHDHWFAPLQKFPGVATPNGISAAVLVVKAIQPPAFVNVDAIGYGASAAERLAEKGPVGFDLPAHAINVAARSEHRDKSGKYRMLNVRAEAYWRLREALDPESYQHLALPDDPELLSDLTSAKYEITTAGIKIEDKAEISARLSRSPDCGDAVALAMLPEPVKRISRMV